MAQDENQIVDQVTDPIATEHVETTTTTPSVEDTARLDGWVPKEEFNGDPNKWVDAGEFNRRGELFKKIEAQSKELKAVKQAMKEFAEHNAKVKEAAYKEALETLKAQRVEALEAGDVREFTKLEDKIEELKTSRETETKAAPQANAGPSEDFLEFHKTNQWYLRDRDLTSFADAIGAQYFQDGHNEKETLAYVEREVRKRFPEKFVKNVPPANAVASGRQAPNPATSTDKAWNALDATSRRIAEKFIKQGVITKEKYLEDLGLIKKSKA